MIASRSLVIVTSFSISFVSFAIGYGLGMLLPEMMDELKLTNLEAGLIGTSYYVSYTLFSFVAGFAADVVGVRRVVLTFLPIMSAGALLMSVARSSVMAMAFFAMTGIGASIRWAPVSVWVQKVYRERRGLAVGILQIGCELGWGLTGMLLPLILPTTGWRGVWVILSAASLSIIPLVILSYEERMEARSGGRLKSHIRELKYALSDARTWYGGLSYLLVSFADVLHMTFFKAYAVKDVVSDLGLATFLYGAAGFIAVIGSALLPAFSDRYGRKVTLLACNVIFLFAFLKLMVASSVSDLMLSIVLFGVGYGGIWPTYMAFIKDVYDWTVVGSVAGMWTLLCGIGMLLAPSVGGLLVDLTGTYRVVYLLSTIAMLLSIALLIPVRRK